MKSGMSVVKLNTIKPLAIALLLGSSLSIAEFLIAPSNAIAGVITLPDGSRCEGELNEGRLSGPGLCQYANGDRYEGQFLNG